MVHMRDEDEGTRNSRDSHFDHDEHTSIKKIKAWYDELVRGLQANNTSMRLSRKLGIMAWVVADWSSYGWQMVSHPKEAILARP